MILKIRFASHAHQHAILVKVIKTLAPNARMSRIESCKDNHAVVCPLTMRMELQHVISATACVKNVR